jgi:ParB family chromosome partitioning protein
MTSKKKRMSMLDNLAATGSPSPAAASSMMSSNRALRSARDAVDGHSVWELDPALISDGRLRDRLDPDDVADLRDAIEVNGQTVPILVRRHPSDPDRYLLVYGRRRLEAIRVSDKLDKVRAIVANIDDDAAVRAQISENMARRDLSFIEKALFAQELIDSGFGTQSQIAEVLTVTKSSISMALAIVETVGVDVIRAIGAAHGVGRPRWDALGKAIEEKRVDPIRLVRIAEDIHAQADVTAVTEHQVAEPSDISIAAFNAVMTAVDQAAASPAAAPPALPRSGTKRRALTVAGTRSGSVNRTAKGISITLENSAFADWVEAEAQDLVEDLHQRWLQRRQD